MTLTIRQETSADHEAVCHVNRLAFGQDGEANLVDALRRGGHVCLSLVAEVNGIVVGHLLFSSLPIETENGIVPALSLAPLAVLPERQNQGIGSALVRAGLETCRRQGHRIVVVLGHPRFYSRFGFSTAPAEPLASPFTGQDAWMALELVPGSLRGVRGQVRYAPPFGIEEPSSPRTDLEDPPSSPSAKRIRLLSVAGRFAVCKLPPGSPPPTWATGSEFFSLTRTADELSVVCAEESVPEGITHERGWRCLRVADAMAFTVVGILAALTKPLAEAGIGVFVFSTFDTDYLFVQAAEYQKTITALNEAGHVIEGTQNGESDKAAKPRNER